MEHQLRFDLGEDPLDRIRVADVDFVQQRAGGQRWLEVRSLSGTQIVDHRHPVATREQSVDKIRADEPGAAGDDAVHAQDL